jgi:transcriptional regulator with XRE-family HTH domain
MSFLSTEFPFTMILSYTLGIDMRADRLKLARIDAGHTQESLAEFLGIDTRQIWRYENEETIPKADMVARIAEALNVSTDYLLGLTDDPTPVEMATNHLSADEKAILRALRQGERMEAIRIISSSGGRKDGY